MIAMWTIIEIVTIITSLSVNKGSFEGNNISIMDKGYLNIPKTQYCYKPSRLDSFKILLSNIVLLIPILNLVVALCNSIVAEMKTNKNLKDKEYLNELSKMTDYQREYYSKLITNAQKMDFLKKAYDIRNEEIDAYAALKEESDRILKETGCLVLQHKILNDASLKEIEEISEMTDLPYLYGYVIKGNKNIAIIGKPEAAIFDIKYGFDEEEHFFNEYISKKDVHNNKFDIYVLDYELLFDDRLQEYCQGKEIEHSKNYNSETIPLKCNLGSSFTIDQVKELSKSLNTSYKLGTVSGKLVALIGFNSSNIDNVLINKNDTDIIYKYREVSEEDILGGTFNIYLPDNKAFSNKEFLTCYSNLLKDSAANKTDDLEQSRNKPRVRTKTPENKDKK